MGCRGSSGRLRRCVTGLPAGGVRGLSGGCLHGPWRMPARPVEDACTVRGGCLHGPWRMLARSAEDACTVRGGCRHGLDADWRGLFPAACGAPASGGWAEARRVGASGEERRLPGGRRGPAGCKDGREAGLRPSPPSSIYIQLKSGRLAGLSFSFLRIAQDAWRGIRRRRCRYSPAAVPVRCLRLLY